MAPLIPRYLNRSPESSQDILSHYHVVFQILPPKCFKYTPSSSFSLPMPFTPSRPPPPQFHCESRLFNISGSNLALVQSAVRMILQDKFQSPCGGTDPFSPGPLLISVYSLQKESFLRKYLLRRLGSRVALWPHTFCSPLVGALPPLASLPHLFTQKAPLDL